MDRGPARRRLAAMPAADVAGCSRLVREDEEDARARFNRLMQEAASPAIEGRGGRAFKTMGDGLLA